MAKGEEKRREEKSAISVINFEKQRYPEALAKETREREREFGPSKAVPLELRIPCRACEARRREGEREGERECRGEREEREGL